MEHVEYGAGGLLKRMAATLFQFEQADRAGFLEITPYVRNRRWRGEESAYACLKLSCGDLTYERLLRQRTEPSKELALDDVKEYKYFLESLSRNLADHFVEAGFKVVKLNKVADMGRAGKNPAEIRKEDVLFLADIMNIDVKLSDANRNDAFGR